MAPRTDAIMEILFHSNFVCSSNFALTSFCVHLFLIGDPKILHILLLYYKIETFLTILASTVPRLKTDRKIGSKYFKIHFIRTIISRRM